MLTPSEVHRPPIPGDVAATCLTVNQVTVVRIHPGELGRQCACFRHTGLDFGVAIGAEQDAFAGLGSELGNAPRRATEADDEGLLTRVQMMELECADVPVVAAYRTTATGFLDEDALNAPAPLTDPLDGTGGTPVVVLLADPHEPRSPVMTAAPQ
jgi:hypothetical protein